MKKCVKCNELKNLEEFGKHPQTRDKLKQKCKTCESAYRKDYYKKNKEVASKINGQWRERNPEYYKNAYKENKEYYRDSELRRSFGIGLSEYKEMFDKQGGTCRICRNPESAKNKSLAVDHCHESGKIRGLLCTSCNKGLGCFKDDVNSLNSAIEYLKGSI